MTFPDNFIETIRESVTLSDVVAKKIKLTRKGRLFLGLCPFHNEKTPSFTVNDEKKFYHCFGCGESGDVINFISKTSNMNFTETIEYIAKENAIALPESKFIKNDVSKKLYEIMDLAARWYNKQLFTPQNKVHLEYLYSRGLNNEIINRFMLGFAEHEQAKLSNYLTSKNINEQTLLDLGLIAKNDNGKIYDRFRDRIMFPIADLSGRFVAFGGRSIHKDAQAKYLNSPETVLFKKKEILYAENLARSAAYNKKRIIIVEGYMDVIAMHMAGFNETVACLGTAVSETHIKKLWKYTQEPIMCLDGDQAGLRAMLKTAYNILPFLKSGYSINFVQLPSGLDPDEFIKLHGQLELEQKLDTKIALSELLWHHEFSQLPNNATPEQKANLENKLYDLANLIEDVSLKSSYRNFFSQKLWQYVKKNVTKKVTANVTRLTTNDMSPISIIEKSLLAIIFNNLQLLDIQKIEEEFTHIEFSDVLLDEIRQTILSSYFETKSIDLNYLTACIEFKPTIDWIQANYKSINHTSNKTLYWDYLIIKHHIYFLEIAYKDLLYLLTEDSIAKAEKMRQEIFVYKKKIANIEQMLDI